MPTEIKTEAARVALASRECDQRVADLEAKLKARLEQLGADYDGTDADAFARFCTEDAVAQRLCHQMMVVKSVRDVLLASDRVATIEDDGTVSWGPPGHAKRP